MEKKSKLRWASTALADRDAETTDGPKTYLQRILQQISSAAIHHCHSSFRVPSRYQILLIILLTPVLLQSQTSSSAFLQGNVYAADGSGIPRAHIELLYEPTGTTYRVAAGDDGHYLIAGVRVGGPYTLRISHVGFGTQVRAALFFRSYENARVDAFLQDELTLSPVLSVSLGIRADVPVFPDRPKDNPTVHEAFLPEGYDLSTTRVPGTRVMLSPRIGFKIDPKPDHSVQVRGGVGVFTGHIPYAWIDNLYDHTGLDYVHIKESAFAPKFVADPSAQPVPGAANRLRETMEIVTITPDFVLPQEVRWTLAGDLALPWNIVASFESVFSRTLNGVVFRNINLRPIDTMKYAAQYMPTPGSGYERVIFKKSDDRFTDAMLMANASGGVTTFHTIQIQRRPAGNGLFASLAYGTGSSKDINSGTWDNAYDQWRYNPAVQPNDPTIDFSAFDRSHRITAALSYQHEWFPGFPTTFGMVYTGISGTPYSYVYEGDLNGDGESLNDLIYIPGQRTEIMLYRGSEERLFYDDPNISDYAELFNFIAKDEYLNTHRGRLAERNGARTPWIHQLDMRIAQCVPLAGSRRLEVSAELLNVLNLLNASWGLVQTVPNNVVPVLRTIRVGFPGFQWAPRTSPLVPEPLLSRWRLRVGLRYSF